MDVHWNLTTNLYVFFFNRNNFFLHKVTAEDHYGSLLLQIVMGVVHCLGSPGTSSTYSDQIWVTRYVEVKKHMQYTLTPDCDGGGTLIGVTRYIEVIKYMQYTLTPNCDCGGTLIEAPVT
jgi:hypothetical protein